MDRVQVVVTLLCLCPVLMIGLALLLGLATGGNAHIPEQPIDEE